VIVRNALSCENSVWNPRGGQRPLMRRRRRNRSRTDPASAALFSPKSDVGGNAVNESAGLTAVTVWLDCAAAPGLLQLTHRYGRRWPSA